MPKQPTSKLQPPSPDFLRTYAQNTKPRAREQALSKAQFLIYDAWEASSAASELALATKALEASPLCADAYLLIADRQRSRRNKLPWLELAALAGELALGEVAFKEMTGKFWGFLETRPYMRARHQLGLFWEDMGNFPSAASHYRDMLVLNPNDNQGARELLAALLMRMENFDELHALLQNYKNDHGPFMGFTRVLLSIARGKPSIAAYRKAATRNAHVAEMLISGKWPDLEYTGYVTYGGEDEAIAYVEAQRGKWLSVPGALEWLNKQMNLPAITKLRAMRASNDN